MLADPRADALVTNFVGQWLFLRNLPTVLPDPRRENDFDEDLRQGFRRETELFAGSILREDRSVLDLLTGHAHVRQRAAREALRHSAYPRHALSSRRAHRQTAPRTSRPGQRPGRHVVPASHVARRSGKMGAREPARRAAASSAADVPALEEKPKPGRRSEVDAGPHRATPRESRLRELPRDDGSAGAVAREFRYGGAMARGRRSAHSDRRVGRAARRHPHLRALRAFEEYS